MNKTEIGGIPFPDLDLRAIKYALVFKSDGPHWSSARADRTELDYRRFLLLMIKYPEVPLVPTEDIDEFWHAHIMDTRKYAADCDKLFGHYLHHFPYFGECGDEDAKNLATAFQQTVDVFRSEFGEAPLATGGALCGKGCGKGCKSCGKNGEIDSYSRETADWTRNRETVAEWYSQRTA
jgi:hypothetical protein